MDLPYNYLGSGGIVLHVCSENKGLISCAVTTQLICAFIFTYAKSKFSHDAADIKYSLRVSKIIQRLLSGMVLSFSVIKMCFVLFCSLVNVWTMDTQGPVQFYNTSYPP